ncbi:beta-ketoacyl-ACP synthase [Rodentibacter haemolyticus]|uniref:Beta-ketoacyl-ACP synthase n=1 Tax=Rodentibacter haemolyticus TaxID=2778911 RepID=A0ABX6UZF8_9PAST|nr:beta-ketoacyl-ACP synthase [Rodentibacter haemolyticus]QPB43487.1 beta-ketoacyl-ACP synthase [Rodentibacter haemolyticus]
MMKLFLSRPAMISALGEGLNIHLDVLLNNKSSPIAATDSPYASHGISAQENMLGEVRVALREFPTELPAEHCSRNNQLLWHALAQIESQIEQVIHRFGKQRVAVVMGTSTTGVDENIPVFQYAAEHNDWSGKPFWQQQQYFSAPADFVAYQYGVQNASYCISTACTSGARALISAARLLKANLCDAVICGGVDTLSPLTISGFSSLEVLSKQRTNPLSANRNGINIGEAAAVFIMTKEAIDEHKIELLGYGTSSDAYHMSSPHPEGLGAISAFENALKSIALLPNQIGWINLHGTGTIHNDQMETVAVAKVFGNQTACTTTKPYTGHTLGAAGALEAAILWAVISRTYNPQGILPPQLWDGVRDENLPEILITNEHSRWAEGRRIGVSSSFAFGGNNAVLILGESE